MHTVAPISLSHFPATWWSMPRVLDSHETESIECRDAGNGEAGGVIGPPNIKKLTLFQSGGQILPSLYYWHPQFFHLILENKKFIDFLMSWQTQIWFHFGIFPTFLVRILSEKQTTLEFLKNSDLFVGIPNTVFPQIVSAETILFWI